MNGICELCRKTTDLQLSHIIPKFVLHWLKKSIPGGIRTSRNPNLRVQDGPKIYLLCADCEQRISEWEKPFYEKVFLPLHSPEPVTKSIRYGAWALKFAVSVSWRVLMFFEHEKSKIQLSPHQEQMKDEAGETWRQFLLSEVDDPGDYNQHLLPLDVIESYEGPKISSFLNRYFLSLWPKITCLFVTN